MNLHKKTASYDVESVFSAAMEIWKTLTKGKDCPPDEILFDYVYDDLESEKAGKVAEHIKTCESCHLTQLEIETDRTGWEFALKDNPALALAKALGPEGIKIVLNQTKKTEKAGISVSAIKEALITWVSPLWQPSLTGAMMTASADVPEQSNHFKMEHGEYINISCAWKGKDRTASAIMLEWNANIFTDSNLWARFIDPDTRDILFESCLGTKLEGEKTFSEQEMGFNPCSQKWAVAIIVEEVS